ncbi:HypC/HybG/HupF family hydrogenase formation chaperone [Lachnospiraceae bacterium YH-ros2228]
MCVALPGKVIQVMPKDRKARVDFNGNTVDARTGLVEIREGDYVLVHAGCILQKMSQSEAEEMTELFASLEGIG